MILKAVGEPDKGTEVGVYEGDMAEALRVAFPACELLLVDPWQEWTPDDTYYQKHRRTGKLIKTDWDAIYKKTMNRMAALGGFNRISRTTSKWAAHVAENKSQDFVFIDANHNYDDVLNDIGWWLPKIKRGGLICGHDYGGAYRGVAKAVDKSFGKKNLIIPGNRTRLWGFEVK